MDDFLGYVGDAGDAGARNRAETLLNRVLECIWMKREWSQFLMPNVYEVATLATSRTIALPDYFGRVSGATRRIRNLTNGVEIDPITRSDLEELDPTQGTSLETPACPTHYMLAGTTPVQTQPAAAGVAMEVVSTSTADTTVRVFVESLDANGIVTPVQVTLNGTTPVAVGTLYPPVTKFGKAYPDGTTPTTEGTSSEGTVSLRRVSDSVVFQRLAPGQDAREHLTLVLYPVPDAAYTIGVPILRGIEQQYRDADPIPAFWRNAVFEKMVIGWRAGDRDGSTIDTADTWPALVDLVCFDNAQTQRGWTASPYGGRY